jgi:hypothetical protein
VFRHRHDDPRKFPIAYGIDFGDGWEPIVRRVSARFEVLGIPVSQVKQKMATLRIYVVDDSPTAEVLEVLRAARDESMRTCEDRHRPKKRRARCLYCKPHKGNGIGTRQRTPPSDLRRMQDASGNTTGE